MGLRSTRVAVLQSALVPEDKAVYHVMLINESPSCNAVKPWVFPGNDYSPKL